MKLLRRSCFCLWLKVRQFFFFFQFWHQANISRQIKPPQVFETSGRSNPVLPFLPCSCFHSTSYASGACFSACYTAFEKLCIVTGSYAIEDDSSSYLDTTSDISKGPVSFSLFLCRSLLHPLSFSLPWFNVFPPTPGPRLDALFISVTMKLFCASSHVGIAKYIRKVFN